MKKNNKKVLAVHLPAFHEIPENNEWWGDGFTEWTNVKSGKPLYNGHYQPIVPMNNNYYDLSKINDLKKQAEMARAYGVYGFVFYHYWFGNGRMLFQKPAEMILENMDINTHFCFAWANGTWYTTWHGLDPKTLLEQKYPGKSDWKKHFEYFKKFFLDDRYIKVDNKPMLYIYIAKNIPDYDEMISYFGKRCQEIGFDGIYTVEYIHPGNKELYSEKSDAVYEFEPRYSLFFDVSKLHLLKRFITKKREETEFESYDGVWKAILSRDRTYKSKTIISGCFSGWDNTARKGKKGLIVEGKSVEKFKKYFEQFYTSKRKDISDEFCVINAWNEWSEGAYLEPDDKDGYGYLEVIRDVVNKYKEN